MRTLERKKNKVKRKEHPERKRNKKGKEKKKKKGILMEFANIVCQPRRGSLRLLITVLHERLGYLTPGPGRALMALSVCTCL